MFCNRCGKEIKEGTKFCPACGKEVKAVQNKAVQSKSVPEMNIELPQKKSRLPIILISVFAVAAVLGVAAALIVLKPWAVKEEPQSVANEAPEEEVKETPEEKAAEDVKEEEPETEEPVKEDADSNSDAWKQAYLDYLEDMNYKEDSLTKYKIVFIDDDDIPELFITHGSMAGGTCVAAYHDGKVEEVYAGEYGALYIEKSGLIHVPTGHGGGYHDEIIKLENGKFTTIASGDYSEWPDGKTEYYWESKEVTEEEYNGHIAELFDDSKSKRMDMEGQDNYPYETLCDLMMDGSGDTQVSAASDAGNENTNKEEMYWAISDLFGDRTVFDGGMFLGLSKYEGDPEGCFMFWGDQWVGYSAIDDFSDNTVTMGSTKIRLISPWMVEYTNSRDGEAYNILTGHIADIDAAMKAGGVPEYIFPDSDHVKIDVYSNYMDYDVVRLAKNEIYARHGRKFKDPELQAFFNARSWYNGTIEPDKFKEDVFNKIEKENITELKRWEDYLADEKLYN